VLFIGIAGSSPAMTIYFSNFIPHGEEHREAVRLEPLGP
jgi:hypothetical protein